MDLVLKCSSWTMSVRWRKLRLLPHFPSPSSENPDRTVARPCWTRRFHTSLFLSWNLPSLCVPYNKRHPNPKGSSSHVILTWGQGPVAQSPAQCFKSSTHQMVRVQSSPSPLEKALGATAVENVNYESWRVFPGWPPSSVAVDGCSGWEGEGRWMCCLLDCSFTRRCKNCSVWDILVQ